MMDRPRILLTGFGPFPGVLVNQTASLIEAVAQDPRAKTLNAEIITAVLPTEWHRGLAAARTLIANVKPHAALHFGVSPLARGFVIEQQACNVCTRSADANGGLPEAPQIAADGPAFLTATVPITAIEAALRASRVPVTLSRDAGRYLCNAVFYQSLSDHMAPTMTGFVHVPKVFGWRGRIKEEQAVRGGIVIVETCLQYLPVPPPPRLT